MPTASEIIERVKARYAGCRTYEDEATITRTTIHGPRPWMPRVHRTHWHASFVRPHLLRFEITELEPRPSRFAGGTIIWNEHEVFNEARSDLSKSSGSRPRSAQVERETRERSPLGSTVLPLLLPLEGSKSRALQFSAPISVELADIEGRAMFALTGPHENVVRRVFVDEASFLLCRVEHLDSRKVDDRLPEIERLRVELAKPHLSEAEMRKVLNEITDLDLVLDGAGTEETIEMNPRMDHDIDPKVFDFSPTA